MPSLLYSSNNYNTGKAPQKRHKLNNFVTSRKSTMFDVFGVGGWFAKKVFLSIQINE